MGPQMGMIGQGPQALRAVACASCRLFSLKNVQEPGLPMLLGKAGRGCTYIRTCMHAYANTHTDRQRQTETDRHIHTNISTYVRTPVCLHARTPACTPARDAHTHTQARARTHPHPRPRHPHPHARTAPCGTALHANAHFQSVAGCQGDLSVVTTVSSRQHAPYREAFESQGSAPSEATLKGTRSGRS